MTFQGLTWDHPRGYDALAKAAGRANAGRPAPLLTWQKQALEGFEQAPIHALAADYDLVVMDHPHIGEAVAEDCLTPLEELFPAEVLQRWRAETVGPAMASYEWGGRTWALPLDVATQVMARRPDRIAHALTAWEEIPEIAKRVPVALSLGGPHALLTLMSLAAGRGACPAGEAFLPDDAALGALDLMARLFRTAPPGSDALNPIALLEAMAGSDEIAFVPLVFGYVTYADRIAFSDTPRGPEEFGGVLGGTGLAISRRATPTPALLDHISWLMDPETQASVFPAHGGQPSARRAWRDPAVNAAWGGFYADTLKTAEHALLRPRFDGYIAFQAAASDRIRRALHAGEDVTQTLAALRRLWRDARARARGPLDDDRGFR